MKGSGEAFVNERPGLAAKGAAAAIPPEVIARLGQRHTDARTMPNS
ncbi:hypothetical protein [Sphingomonas sp.]|nr:hypothetical protein [Sphingomonas sp.]MBO9713305.1 hypothetical protein [Sphingomonas sp.]